MSLMFRRKNKDKKVGIQARIPTFICVWSKKFSGQSCLNILAEVGEAHVTLAEERVMEGECGTHVLRLMANRGDVLQIVAQHRTVVGMCAVFDNLLSTAHRAFPAQVGNALFRSDDIYVMFR